MENITSKRIKRNKENLEQIEILEQDYGSDLPNKKFYKDELDYYANVYPTQPVWMALRTQDDLRKSTNSVYDKFLR